jgi:hypothetical protein
MPETAYSLCFCMYYIIPLLVWDLKPLIVTENPSYFLHAWPYDGYLYWLKDLAVRTFKNKVGLDGT